MKIIYISKVIGVTSLLLLSHLGLTATTIDPFITPIVADKDVIVVNVNNFATIPPDNGDSPRLMLLLDEPGTQRLFVNTMTGKLYGINYDGSNQRLYIDINDPRWGVSVQSRGSERGFQSFAFHPQFAEQGSAGYGKFYTYTDTSNTDPKPDYLPAGSSRRSHDTVLLEWSAKTAAAASYDGGTPREIFRAAQPYGNHNAGHAAFNPLAKPGDEDYGLFYVGSADGGSGGDPLNLSQNMASAFGKVLRIDPLGNNSANKQFGIPPSNPFANGANNTLPEIYASGVRNPQRFGWDAKTGAMYVADIGQNAVEEISPVVAGGNLGWNRWEGSFSYFNRQAETDNPRSEEGLIYPVVEYDHKDPLFGRTAITGLHIYRSSNIPQLNNLMIFGDNPSGELFYVNADELPEGGQDKIRRILFKHENENLSLLELIKKNKSASRVDMRMGATSERVFVLNKRDGVIRELLP